MKYIAKIVPGDDLFFDYNSPEEIDISGYTFTLTIKNTLMGDIKISTTNTPSDHEDAHNTTFHLSRADTLKLSPPYGWMEIRFCDPEGNFGSVKLGGECGPQKVLILNSLSDESDYC
jgi:hypothetical protein